MMMMKMKMKSKIIVITIVIIVLFAKNISGCGDDVTGTTPISLATDYSQAKYWLALPSSIEKEVDVFYLYPTEYQRDPNDPNAPIVCAIDNNSMVTGANAAFQRQATAFETIGNIYAPYYRQADAIYTLSLPLEQQQQIVGGIPTRDAVAAFDYYIKNYNNGRPFILAGHSQGSNILLNLLSDYYMKYHLSDVYPRMIAAYVIGYSVTQDYLDQNLYLKFAEGPDDTGVIISYNTEAPDVNAKNPVLLPGAIAINPITWTREETLATARQSLGSLLPDSSGNFVVFTPDYADAQINKTRGVVVCSTASVDDYAPGNQLLPRGVFHSFDYPFYYYNIRENAVNRTRNYLDK